MTEKRFSYNDPLSIAPRKKLRNQSTFAEVALWRLINRRQIGGAKFRRQFAIGNFILDFYCPELRLCIELDGQPHFTEEGMKDDEARTEYLETFHHITVLRFENRAILDCTETVLSD